MSTEEVLLKEYEQLNEHVRHENTIASGKERIFLPVAFGILGYALTKHLSLCESIVGALLSLGIYLYHLLSCERLAFDCDVKFARIREIEEHANEIVGSKALRFQKGRLDRYKKDAKDLRKRSRCRYDPYGWVTWLVERGRVGQLRTYMGIGLLCLWIVRIGWMVTPAKSCSCCGLPQ